jgi:hypothetical protein
MTKYNPQQAHRIIELAESRVIDIRHLFNHYTDKYDQYPPAEWWIHRSHAIREAQDFLEALFSIVIAEKELQGIEGLRHVRTDREQKFAERSAIRKAERRDWWLETRSQEEGTID